MFTENPERIIKEKQFLKNYTVLNLNDSHIVPLEDLYERIDIKSEDDEHGKKISFRAENEEVYSNQDSNNSPSHLKLSLYPVLLTSILAFLL